MSENEFGTEMAASKRFEGFSARFGTDPDEVYVELRAGRPTYIRLREGDYLQEGDAFRREQLGMSSPTLDTWEVAEISPESVTGVDVKTDEERVWDREAVEKGLVVGRYSTNLTDFEAVSVLQTGRWEDVDPEVGSRAGYRYVDEPYVTVVAYGDNGLKYGRRYRFVAGEGSELELWTQDVSIEDLRDEVRGRLDRRVRKALEDDGYTVRPTGVNRRRRERSTTAS